MSKIEDAIIFATNAHRGQFRKSGITPYVFHPIQVMLLLKNIEEYDTEIMLCSAVLHDVLEDTETTYQQLEDNFGKKIADIVNELTCTGNKQEYMLSFKDKSIEALVIKIVDRWCNIQDFALLNDDYVYKYAKKALVLPFEKITNEMILNFIHDIKHYANYTRKNSLMINTDFYAKQESIIQNKNTIIDDDGSDDDSGFVKPNYTGR